MNDVIYLVVRSKGLGHEMYYCHGRNGFGVSWTFNITKAIYWETDEMPHLIAASENSLSVSVVIMARKEYFKRKLKGK